MTDQNPPTGRVVLFGATGYTGDLTARAMAKRGMRPVLLDINSQVSPRTEKDLPTASLRLRLIAAVPLIVAIYGITQLTSRNATRTSMRSASAGA